MVANSIKLAKSEETCLKFLPQVKKGKIRLLF